MSRRLTIGLLAASVAIPAMSAEAPRVLLLSKSSGFQHSAITRHDGEPSHVEKVLAELAKKNDFEIEFTKDGGKISSASLANFDAVIFYTTGDLTVVGGGKTLFGGDGNPAMSATGVQELRDWVAAGGALLGFHSATDTFHEEGGVSPYVDLLGGEFLGHGRQFEGRLEVVDTEHPTMRSIPQGFTVQDEWYFFKNLDEKSMHVLALLDTASDEHDQEAYDRPAYPIIWCKEVGAGRVFYNAMGHREDVWDHPTFQAAFVDALRWSVGESESRAEPNLSGLMERLENLRAGDSESP